MIHPTWIEIDLDRFRENLKLIRQGIGKVRFCLPVKANAYGHGMVSIAKAAQSSGVVDCLAVSCLQEGVKLKEAGMQIPILVLGAIHEDQIEDLAKYELEFSISSLFKAQTVSKIIKKKRVPVHIEVETGMQRSGSRPETCLKLAEYIRSQPCFDLIGVYSHFATADSPSNPFAKSQMEQFRNLIQHPLFQGLITHMANSSGVVHYPESHFDMVRPGLMAYGYPPQGAGPPFDRVAPCFSLKSKVAYFKVVGPNQGVGYGHTYVTSKETRIVTVPIGYGDGYRRALSNLGFVLIRGKRFKIAGTICMDQFMVDVGDAESYVGDEVVLIGKQGEEEIQLSEIAQGCHTIPYEILSQFNERIPRVFLSSQSALV